MTTPLRSKPDAVAPEPFRTDELPGITTQAAKSGAAMFLSKSVRFGFLLLVNFILINLLIPADFGLVRYVLMVVGIANLLNEMGLTAAIVQRATLERENLWSLVCISSGWGICLYAALFFAAPFIASYFAVPELVLLLRWGALIIPAAGVSAVQRALLRREMKFKILAIIEVSATAVSAVVSVIMALSGCGVWSLIVASLLFEVITSGVILLICRVPVHPIQPFRLLRPVLFFGMAIVISRIVDYVLCNAPFFLIGKVIGREGLGLFSVAHDIAMFPQTALYSVLGLVLVSWFSRLQSDDEKTAFGLTRLLLFGSLLTIPVFLMMVVMPAELLRVICLLKKNSSWIDAAPLLRWLALTGITYAFTTFSSSIWLSRGKIVQSIFVSVAMCITIVIAIIIGVRWGLVGVSIALFIRAIIVFLPYVYINFRLTRVPVSAYLGALVPAVVAGGLMTLVLLAVKRLLPGETITGSFVVLCAGAGLGIAGYAAVIWFFFHDSAVHLGQMLRMLLPEPLANRFVWVRT
jgi:PST family polysaccharide transporter